jgi:hypothetical protein
MGEALSEVGPEFDSGPLSEQKLARGDEWDSPHSSTSVVSRSGPHMDTPRGYQESLPYGLLATGN